MVPLQKIRIPQLTLTWQERVFSLFAVLTLVLVALYLQTRWSPANSRISTDGTVFAYGGARILQGDLPYRDFWDHKPPGVFYLDALAFKILGTDDWALWYLALAWTLGIVLVFYGFLKKLIRAPAAIAGTLILLIMILQPDFYEGTNLTEFYGLLPAVLALLFTYLYIKNHHPLALLALGGAFAAGVLFKQTNMGTSLGCIAAIVYLEIRRKGFLKTIQALLWVAIFPALTLTAILFYWGLHNSLPDLWQATIGYNLIYVKGSFGLKSVYGSLRILLSNQAVQPLLILAVAAILTHFASRLSWKNLHPANPKQIEPDQPVVDSIYLACFVALAFEILVMSVERRPYGHYYITIFPALCASASYWYRPGLITSGFSDERVGLLKPLPVLVNVVLLACVIVAVGLVRPTTANLRSFITLAPQRKPFITEAVQYVKTHTRPQDTVLTWDLGSEVNFESGRRAPSRYPYYLPLFQEGYDNQRRWSEFLSDLKTNQPVLLLVRAKSPGPRFDVPPKEVASKCPDCSPEVLTGFTSFADYVRENYVREVLFDGAYIAFHRKMP